MRILENWYIFQYLTNSLYFSYPNIVAQNGGVFLTQGEAQGTSNFLQGHFKLLNTEIENIEVEES